LVSYTAQTGDTLPALAQRFNTTVEEIRSANAFIPADATTMPPGMPMEIPIYYRPLWGTPYQMIPDSVFVNGPDAAGFNTQNFLAQQSGWLPGYYAWAFKGTRSAAEIVDYVAMQYAISPKLLLALLEYQGGAFSDPLVDNESETQILGLDSNYWVGVYLQLSYAANILNDGYYRWREGDLLEFELADGSLVRPDPWQNAATVALQYFFSQVLDERAFHYAIGPDGFALVFTNLFGNPWTVEPHIPGSLVQPEMQLPYRNDVGWAYTGGPHTAWGSMAPWAAIDFAPPSTVTG
jgi:LasA protease